LPRRGAALTLHIVGNENAGQRVAEVVPERGHDPEALVGIMRQLRGPAPPGEVHVLALVDGCAATVTARANAEMVASRDADEARIQRIAELLARRSRRCSDARPRRRAARGRRSSLPH
jgi:hypothetical protein